MEKNSYDDALILIIQHWHLPDFLLTFYFIYWRK